jgi:iron-sulfur cluster assembly accessory protein
MTDTSVTLSDAAAKRIAAIVGAEAGKSALRVSVEGGGCSGFSYKFDLADGVQDDDVIVEKNNAKVLIDSLSLVYMAGRRSTSSTICLANPSRSRTRTRWRAAAAAPASRSEDLNPRLSTSNRPKIMLPAGLSSCPTTVEKAR